MSVISIRLQFRFVLNLFCSAAKDSIINRSTSGFIKFWILMTDMTPSTESVYEAKPWLKSYDLWAPAEINPPNQPLYQILQIASVAYRDKPAVAFMGAFID